MGYSISWIAFSGIPQDEGLSRLGLHQTSETAEYARPKFSGQSLPDGWYLVVARGCDHKIISASSLARLSADCVAVAGSVEEHVMCSAAEGWRHGAREWRVAHDAQESTRHLECIGKPPAAYGSALAEAKDQQDAEDAGDQEVDFYFEVPLQVAKSLVGFKHDEECPGIDYSGFAVLEQTGVNGERRWWQFWK